MLYINLAGIKASNVEVVNSGTVAYFPARKDVDEVDGQKLKINWGNLKNAAVPAADTNVIFDVAFNILHDHAGGDCDSCLGLSIGGVDITLPSFTVSLTPVSSKTQTNKLSMA